MTRNILIVDDEPRIREVLEYALGEIGFEVTSAGGGAEALEFFGAGGGFDLVILDVLMPDIDGLEVCRRIRQCSPVPVIFLSSRGEEADRVVGLELGGDDYVCKPFSPRELCARVRSVLRRTHEDASRPSPERTRLKFGALLVDRRRHAASVGETPISLTATEFSVLEAVLAAAGQVLSRRELIDLAYGKGHHVAERTIDTHVKRLRRKLTVHGIDPIATVTGVGYRASDLATP